MSADDLNILQQEAQALREYAQLQRDPVFAGRDVPRGDGRLVLVVPGLFGNDFYLQPLQGWLGRLGYASAWSTLFPNAGCPQRLSEQVERALERQRGSRPGPIALIGHSRGGMLAWALAARLQEQVSHIALLGSPAGAVVRTMRAGGDPMTYAASPDVARPSVVEAGRRALRLFDPDCNVPECGCAYVGDLRRDLHPDTRVLSIASRDDAIVAPAASEVPGADNIEVTGTHSGLVVNRDVYRHLARFLAA